MSKTYTYTEQPDGAWSTVRSLFSPRTASRAAVSDVHLEVAAGEVIGLLGPNGAGKTTVVKTMSGLLEPTSGQVSVCGHRPAGRSFDFLSQISVIFGQKSMLWWDVSTLQSLRVHRAIYRLEVEAFRRRVGQLTELLQLSEVISVPVRHLSLGQRMRCELAAALLHSPRLLFADEPTIGLDVQAKVAVRRFLAEVNGELGVTIVLTSHDVGDVEALCRRVVIVDHGRTRFDGDLQGLRARVGVGRRVVLTYRHPAAAPSDLPAGATVIAASLTGATALELAVADDAVGAVLSAASTWGDLLDVELHEPGLDEVLDAAFTDAGRR